MKSNINEPPFHQKLNNKRSPTKNIPTRRVQRRGDRDDGDEPPDQFVTDTVVAEEFNITKMTIWRYDHDPAMAELGWPARIVIRNRIFRSRKQIEAYKAAMLRRAMADRKKLVSA